MDSRRGRRACIAGSVLLCAFLVVTFVPRLGVSGSLVPVVLAVVLVTALAVGYVVVDRLRHRKVDQSTLMASVATRVTHDGRRGGGHLRIDAAGIAWDPTKRARRAGLAAMRVSYSQVTSADVSRRPFGSCLVVLHTSDGEIETLNAQLSAKRICDVLSTQGVSLP